VFSRQNRAKNNLVKPNNREETHMNKWLRRSAFIFMLTIVTALSAFADQDKASMGCRDKWENDRFTHCEIQEQNIGAERHSFGGRAVRTAACP